jgi:hypothetical protein
MNEEKAYILAEKIVLGERVSRWEIMAYKHQLRELLQFNEDALHDLEIMIEEAEN